MTDHPGTPEDGAGGPQGKDRSGSGQDEPRKARVIDGTAEDVTEAGPAARGSRMVAVVLPILAFFGGAVLLVLALWQAGLVGTGAVPAQVERRLEAAETRIEALLRDHERLVGALREAEAARDALADQIAAAQKAIAEAGTGAATGTGPDEVLAKAEDLDAALRLIAEIDGRLGELEKTVAVIPDLAPAARVAEVEAALEALTAQVAEAAALARQAAALDRRIAAIETGIAAVGARQEAMAAELAEMRARLAALQAADATLTATLQARVDAPEAARRAALGIALASLAGAVAEGRPFAEELSAVRALAPEATAQVPGIDELAAWAQAGVPDAAALLTTFRPAARDALRAQAAAGAQGWWDRLVANARTLVTVRRTGNAAGEDVEAVLARAEAALERGDVAAAVAEVSRLEGPAAQAMAGWLEQARARARAQALVESLRAHLLADLARAHAPGAHVPRAHVPGAHAPGAVSSPAPGAPGANADTGGEGAPGE